MSPDITAYEKDSRRHPPPCTTTVDVKYYSNGR